MASIGGVLTSFALNLQQHFGVTETVKIISPQIFERFSKECESLRTYTRDDYEIDPDTGFMTLKEKGPELCIKFYSPGPDIEIYRG